MKLLKIWLVICVMILALIATGCNMGNQKRPAPVRPKTQMTAKPSKKTPSKAKPTPSKGGNLNAPGQTKQKSGTLSTSPSPATKGGKSMTGSK